MKKINKIRLNSLNELSPEEQSSIVGGFGVNNGCACSGCDWSSFASQFSSFHNFKNSSSGSSSPKPYSIYGYSPTYGSSPLAPPTLEEFYQRYYPNGYRIY